MNSELDEMRKVVTTLETEQAELTAQLDRQTKSFDELQDIAQRNEHEKNQALTEIDSLKYKVQSGNERK